MSSTPNLIVIDGGDNVGKATQAKLLVERLKKEGQSVATIDFPQYQQNTFGQLLDEYLHGQHGNFLELDPRLASILYAADRFESKDQLTRWREDEYVVVMDRYVSANMLHQGAKLDDPKEREQFLSWLEHIEYEIFGVPRPDLTIYLDVPPEESVKLLERLVAEGKTTADLAEKDRAHQAKVIACAEYLTKTRPDWVAIQCVGEAGLRTPEDIHEEIYTLITTHQAGV
jgi:dTMP kinase